MERNIVSLYQGVWRKVSESEGISLCFTGFECLQPERLWLPGSDQLTDRNLLDLREPVPHLMHIQMVRASFPPVSLRFPVTWLMTGGIARSDLWVFDTERSFAITFALERDNDMTYPVVDASYEALTIEVP